MQVRLLRYFVTLASEGHFGRAAERCCVTQPTLSAGIAALETQLGRRLVLRDRRYAGLTPEGQAVLPLARQIVAAHDELSHAVEGVGGPLRGEARLGVIPAAMPIVGRFLEALVEGRPELTAAVQTLTSRQIERGLAAFELDAGITYLDHEPPAGVLAATIYAESYLFVERRGGAVERGATIGWDAAAKSPLCLLHPGMQNRRILDALMAERGLALRPQVVADSYVALISLVGTGRFSSIIPDSYARLFPLQDWANVLPLDPPAPASRIGLIALNRTPVGPLATLALDAARRLALQGV